MIAEEFISQGYPVRKVLGTLGIAVSSYYYQSVEGRQAKGKRKSTHTRKQDGKYISNEVVVKEIEDLLSQEFVDYGYRKVTHWLRQQKGYLINEKKVYRLMSEHKLLKKRPKHRRSNRRWVKQLVPQPSGVLEYLEFDIKYIYVGGKRTIALLLSTIDVSSRWVLGQYMGWRISKHEVIELFEKLFAYYPLPERIYVRNDNGSQFEAQLVQDYFKAKGVIQEFTLPATPEQNAHIESYHSIIESVICQRYDFEDLTEVQDTFNRWIKFYNMERIHSGIDYLSPRNFLATKGIALNWTTELEEILSCKTLNFT
jgi:transposase InsO family protein